MKLGAGASCHHAVLMFDEITIEKCLRYKPKKDIFVGVCRENTDAMELKFVSEKELEEVYNAVDDGKVHIAGEVRGGCRVTIYFRMEPNTCLIPSSNSYSRRPWLHWDFYPMTTVSTAFEGCASLPTARRKMANNMPSSSPSLWKVSTAAKPATVPQLISASLPSLQMARLVVARP